MRYWPNWASRRFASWFLFRGRRERAEAIRIRVQLISIRVPPPLTPLWQEGDHSRLRHYRSSPNESPDCTLTRQRPKRWPRRAWSGGITCALLARTATQPAVIARVPQGPKRSLGPLAPGSPRDIPSTQSAPPVGAGRFAERASAYWITRRCTKVWSPAVTFTRYMPLAMEASRAITVFRVLPFTGMVCVPTL